MLTFAQLPAWLKSGELYLSMVLSDDIIDKKKEEIDKKKEEIDAMEMVRHVKTDLSFTGLQDVLELLDSALYMGVDKLPPDIYRYCCETPALIDEMDRLESDPNYELACYQHFTTTTEYAAFRICAESQRSVQYTEGNQLEKAIKANNKPLVRYYIEDCNACTMDHFSLAVKSGNVAMCDYIVKTTGWIQPIQDSWGHCRVAAMNGDLPMLRYLKEKLKVYCPYSVVEAALHNDKNECAEYALRTGCQGPVSLHIIDYAIQSGSIEIVRLLIEQGVCVASPILFNFAIQFGKIDIVMLLYEHGARPSIITSAIANSSKNAECIRFMQQITV